MDGLQRAGLAICGSHHGAPYVTATSADFDTCLRELIASGHATRWVGDKGHIWTVGKPGMSGMAVGLDMRVGTQIKAINLDQPGWRLHYDDTELAASHVVLTDHNHKWPVFWGMRINWSPK